MDIGESTSAARRRAQTWPPAPRSNLPVYPELTYDELMDKTGAKKKPDEEDDESQSR